jgi:hypothetical protein
MKRKVNPHGQEDPQWVRHSGPCSVLVFWLRSSKKQSQEQDWMSRRVTTSEGTEQRRLENLRLSWVAQVGCLWKERRRGTGVEEPQTTVLRVSPGMMDIPKPKLFPGGVWDWEVPLPHSVLATAAWGNTALSSLGSRWGLSTNSVPGSKISWEIWAVQHHGHHARQG